MANLIISDTLAERLKRFAERQNKPVESVLESMLERFEPEVSEKPKVIASFDFNGDYEIWSPQTDEEGIETMYRVLEEHKRKKNAK